MVPSGVSFMGLSEHFLKVLSGSERAKHLVPFLLIPYEIVNADSDALVRLPAFADLVHEDGNVVRIDLDALARIRRPNLAYSFLDDPPPVGGSENIEVGTSIHPLACEIYENEEGPSAGNAPTTGPAPTLLPFDFETDELPSFGESEKVSSLLIPEGQLGVDVSSAKLRRDRVLCGET